MSKHDGNIEYTRENYREELKFDKKVKQTCERCDNYSLILTRPFMKLRGIKFYLEMLHGSVLHVIK